MGGASFAVSLETAKMASTAMRTRIALLDVTFLCLFALPPTGLTGQVESCETQPMRLAVVFDQSLSTPVDSTRSAYPAILSTAYSVLQPSDQLLVYRFPSSRRSEIERISRVTVAEGGSVPANDIVRELLKEPTHDSDLSRALQSIAERFESTNPCRAVVVVVTDGSLSPFQRLPAHHSADDVRAVVEDLRSAIAGARNQVDLYVLGFHSGRQLAIDSTYWAEPRSQVVDDFWDVDLSRLKGDDLLRHAFDDHYFEYSTGTVTDLLLFSPSSAFAGRGYRAGLPHADEQLTHLYVRVPFKNAACRNWSHSMGRGLREIGGANDRCVFYSRNPHRDLVQRLQANDSLTGFAVIHQPSHLYSFEGIPPDLPFRHAFVVGRGSAACSPHTLLTHLADNGTWPPRITTGEKMFVEWKVHPTAAGGERSAMIKEDSLTAIGDTGCLALFDLFSGATRRSDSMWPVLFHRNQPAQGPIRQFPAFEAYPYVTDLVLTRRILKKDFWRLHGRIAVVQGSGSEAWFLIAGFRLSLAATADRSRCRRIEGAPEGETCYRLNTRFTRPEGAQVGVLLLGNEHVNECERNCFPVSVSSRFPWLRVGVVLLICLVLATLLEFGAPANQKFKAFIERRLGKREPSRLNLGVNLLVTTYWLFLLYVVAESAVIPDTGILRQFWQVLLACLGTGILLSAFDATIDIGSTDILPS